MFWLVLVFVIKESAAASSLCDGFVTLYERDVQGPDCVLYGEVPHAGECCVRCYLDENCEWFKVYRMLPRSCWLCARRNKTYTVAPSADFDLGVRSDEGFRFFFFRSSLFVTLISFAVHRVVELLLRHLVKQKRSELSDEQVDDFMYRVVRKLVIFCWFSLLLVFVLVALRFWEQDYHNWWFLSECIIEDNVFFDMFTIVSGIVVGHWLDDLIYNYVHFSRALVIHHVSTLFIVILTSDLTNRVGFAFIVGLYNMFTEIFIVLLVPYYYFHEETHKGVWIYVLPIVFSFLYIAVRVYTIVLLGIYISNGCVQETWRIVVYYIGIAGIAISWGDTLRYSIFFMGVYKIAGWTPRPSGPGSIPSGLEGRFAPWFLDSILSCSRKKKSLKDGALVAKEQTALLN